LTAVREDRTPGGKHRVKKIRMDDGGDIAHFSSQPDSATVEKICSEEDELLIQQLVEAKPDLIPGQAGNYVGIEINCDIMEGR